MATLEQLSIRGVRSFGTDAEDEQVSQTLILFERNFIIVTVALFFSILQKISFSAPLTLILGENGSGKTTIIECLKYALTGECPIGTANGKLFVHDPKIFNNRESLARVKLQVSTNNDIDQNILV